MNNVIKFVPAIITDEEMTGVLTPGLTDRILPPPPPFLAYWAGAETLKGDDPRYDPYFVGVSWTTGIVTELRAKGAVEGIDTEMAIRHINFLQSCPIDPGLLKRVIGYAISVWWDREVLRDIAWDSAVSKSSSEMNKE